MPDQPPTLDYAQPSITSAPPAKDEREPVDLEARNRVRNVERAVTSLLCSFVILLIVTNALILALGYLFNDVGWQNVYVLLAILFLPLSAIVIAALSLGILFVRKSYSPMWHLVIPIVGLAWAIGMVCLILFLK